MASFSAMSGQRRRFGRVRLLPSGRFQARYYGDDGRIHRAPTTFGSEKEADQFLATVEADLRRGTWFDTTVGKIRLMVYAPQWISERPVELQPRTLEIYYGLLRNHIYPTFGRTYLSRITSAAVRTWHAYLRDKVSAPSRSRRPTGC
jgi:Phage integrase, N-terminal SAM-like domain